MTSDPRNDQGRSVMTPQSEQVVRSYWERVWRQGDLDALADLVTDPIRRHTSEGSETITLAQLRARLSAARQAVRFCDIVFDALSSDGDFVWVRLTLRGVSLATSAPMTLAWMAHYRIEAQRIAELWALHQPGVDWSR